MKKRLTNEEFIFKARIIHGEKYDYSLVNYINGNTKVKIICTIHGIFEQYVKNHLYEKCSCPKCGSANTGKKRLNIDDFINRALKIHNDKYDYSNVIYLSYHQKVKISCRIHGEFEQSPDNHLRGNGCPKCKSSKGEILINNILTENKIKFISQMKFDDCKNKRKLPFDFYLFNNNICIEYDGEQHFKSKSNFGGDENFNKIKINDGIKTKYCLDNNIDLIRISYIEKEVENYLISEINSIIIKK